MNKETAIEIIWDYMLMHHKLEKADAVFIFCSNDIRVAEYGAELYHRQLAPLVVVSGDGTKHASALLKDSYQGQKEAELFKEVLIAKGVPDKKILLEDKANNTEENFKFTKSLLLHEKVEVKSAIVVQKPYMERRTFATGKIFWPDLKMMITSPNLNFYEYPQEPISEDLVVNLMVGDLQRIKEYPKQGFQIEQPIPTEVWDAYEFLVGLGYTKHLI